MFALQNRFFIKFITVSIIINFLLFTTTNSQCNGTYCGWIEVSGSYPDVLPRATMGSAAGYDATNDRILIIGGSFHSQLVTFSGSQFHDEGSHYLADGTYGYGQYYTQIDNILWMIHEGHDGFITMDTETLQPNYPSIQIPVDVEYYGCLASMKTMYHEYLFVFGADNELQIYDITSGKWISSAPKLDIKRIYLACLVHNDTLYAIGGYAHEGHSQYLDSIEILDVGNDLYDINNRNWNYIEDRLSHGLCECGGVVYGDDIIVIGGYYIDNSGTYPTDINVIDTITLTVKVDGAFAGDWGMANAAVIVYDDVLYAFGGDRYLKLPLGPTRDPTRAPTESPSDIPTIDPTVTPTQYPSLTPTRSPTSAPTQSPTATPTRDPTSDPSEYPSIATTTSPTSTPTQSPSEPSVTSTIQTGYAVSISLITLLVIVIGVLLFLLCLCGGYILYTKYMKRRSAHSKYVRNIQMDLVDQDKHGETHEGKADSVLNVDGSDQTTAFAQTNKL